MSRQSTLASSKLRSFCACSAMACVTIFNSAPTASANSQKDPAVPRVYGLCDVSTGFGRDESESTPVPVGKNRALSSSAHGFVRTKRGAITTFDPIGSASTVVTGINDTDVITGYFLEGSSTIHGFVRAADGTISSFDPVESGETCAMSINSSGVIAGFYYDSSDVVHGFVRQANGSITSFDPSGSTGTYTVSINDDGLVAGTYCFEDQFFFPFLFNSVDATFDTFNPCEFTTDATVTALNNHGAMVGYCGDFLGQSGGEGFAISPRGKSTRFQVSDWTGTKPSGINGNSVVTGYGYTSGEYESFLRGKDGILETFDYSGVNTYALSVNRKGVVAGTTGSHGFLRDTSGTIVTFDPNGSTDTVPTSINTSSVIAGYFSEESPRSGKSIMTKFR